MKKQLILIASAPRSGSTWFSNILNSHPAILYRHEPLARLAPIIDPTLLFKLKYEHSLSKQERSQLLMLLRKANPESDRPPFFTKSYTTLSPHIRFLFWALSMKCRPFGTAYEKFFSPDLDEEEIMVIKETGWSSHLESIILGLQPSATIILLRHPCAIISSIIRGIENHLMRFPDEAMKQEWFDHHRLTPFLQKNKYKAKDIIQSDPLTFWALRLRVLYEIFLSLQAKNLKRTIPIVYENMQKKPLDSTVALFAKLGIPLTESVELFIKSSTGKTPIRPHLTFRKEREDRYFSVHRQRNYNPWEWKSRLSEQQIERICSIIGTDILEKFWPTLPQK